MAYTLEPLSGAAWRMLAIRYQRSPCSGEGARRLGGRWNAPGVPALYLATDPATAVAEFYQGLPRPGTLVPFALQAGAIADLTEGHGRPRDADVAAALRAPWRAVESTAGATPPGWRLATDLIALGAEGALVPSAQNRGGTALVLWRWHDAGAGVGEGAALTMLNARR